MSTADVGQMPATVASLTRDLGELGIEAGDGVFVHASMRAIGPTVGGARAVVQALLDAVGPGGLIGMPGFSADAAFPEALSRASLSPAAVEAVEQAVLGFDPRTSPAAGMGAIAETFRTWPGTRRSDHPTTSICLNGADAAAYVKEHPLAWATGADSPLGRLRARPRMKMLLIGVGWNRCTVLHTAEGLAPTMRTKVRRFKSGPGDAPWVETPDVADDLNRLFPQVGAAFEDTGAVRIGMLGDASVRLCAYAPLVSFATAWIDAANRDSGDRH
ncbi:MAG: AAC(3) family N-acetyltransferase [Pseudomonadota bacterium]